MPQFDVTSFSSQIFWLLICFIFLCIVMSQHLLPRLSKSLLAREQRLQEDWEQAKALAENFETLQSQNLIQLSQAHGKAHNMLRQALEEAQAHKKNALKKLEAELSEKIKKIRNDLSEDQGAIVKDMGSLVAQIILKAAPQILGQPIPETKAKSVIKEVLNRRSQA